MTGTQRPFTWEAPIEFIDHYHPNKEGGAALAEVG
ncbi:hypothetical protein FHX06_006428 [Rhizobium sp. BK512]|nr:hypothetical protein [Rhizobium sp. BK512]